MTCRQTPSHSNTWRRGHQEGGTASAYAFSIVSTLGTQFKRYKSVYCKKTSLSTVGPRNHAPSQGSCCHQSAGHLCQRHRLFNLKAESLWEKKALVQLRGRCTFCSPHFKFITDHHDHHNKLCPGNFEENLSACLNPSACSVQKQDSRGPRFVPKLHLVCQSRRQLVIDRSGSFRQGHVASGDCPRASRVGPTSPSPCGATERGARSPPTRPARGHLARGGGGGGQRELATWGEGSVPPACPRGGGPAPGPPRSRPGPRPVRGAGGATDSGRTDA